jgi:catechol 2,3-dioxygenase-like lactoylglutathione lyase family enzyme
MISLKKLQHIGIPVTDITKSIAFYGELGFVNAMQSAFELDGETGTCVMMQQGEIIFELYQLPPKFLNEVKMRNHGHVDHIAFDVKDIDDFYAKIKAAGFTILEPAPVWLPFWKNGCKYFNITGPDGEKLEFNEIL